MSSHSGEVETMLWPVTPAWYTLETTDQGQHGLNADLPAVSAGKTIFHKTLVYFSEGDWNRAELGRAADQGVLSLLGSMLP